MSQILAFTPASPSLATRQPSLRGRGSFRGALVASIRGHRRIVLFESRLELMTAYVWLTRRDVVDFRDQYPVVSFTEDGKRRQHTFDYSALLADGRWISLACKPGKRADDCGFRHRLALIADQCRSRVGEVRLITEKSFTRAQVRNAELMHHMASEHDPETDAALDLQLAALEGTTTVGNLVEATGLGGMAYRAVMRAIVQGRCQFEGGQAVGYSTVVTAAAI